ncbi:MAG: TIGR01777 family oxidoreductase [Chloroflexi bacterium]|nr:TIGR01777 family oxidoreductase [Chloroflexota bacterium]
MRVIIAGGSGLIGRALTHHLCAQGHSAVVLSRQPLKVPKLPDGADVAYWDGSGSEGLVDLVDGAHAVVNLAGESIAGRRWTPAQKRRLRDSRIRSTSGIVAAIRAAPRQPAVLLQASAVGYYGNTGKEVDEQQAPGSDFLAELSQEWEHASAAVEESSTRRVLLRMGVSLSMEGGMLPRVALPFRFFAGGALGTGRQWVPWIHIEDTVRAIAFLLTHDHISGPVNVCAPQPVRFADFASAVGRTLRRPSLFRVPPWALRLGMGEMADIVLHGQRAVPARLTGAGFEFRYPVVEDALSAILRAET